MAVSPLFAEDIGWVVSTLDMMELGDGRGDAFTDLVERQGIVALVEACMGNGGAVHHGFIVTKHHRAAFDGNSEIAKLEA